MQIKEEITSTTLKTIFYLCDKCKSKISIEDYSANLNFSPGYGSEYDGEHYTLDLCEKCFWDLFKNITGENLPAPGVYSEYKVEFKNE